MQDVPLSIPSGVNIQFSKDGITANSEFINSFGETII